MCIQKALCGYFGVWIMFLSKMKKAGFIAQCCVIGAALVGCGGGSTGASISPAVTQPPPPAPVPNTSLANLVNTETFDVASAVMSLDVSLSGQGSNQSYSSGNISPSTQVTYNASSDSFTLKIIQGDANYNQTFSPANIDAAQSDADFTIYDKSGDLLIYLNPHAPLLDLEYVTLGAWVSDAASPRDLTFGYLAGGIQTPDGDMPTTGTASYQGEIAGTGITKPLGVLYLIAGPVAIEADFATGSVVSTVTVLRTDYLTGGTYAPYLFESNGSIATGTNLFGGTISSLDGSGLVGRLDGAFFGPTANEVGGTFNASNANDDMVGVFVGGP